MFMCVCALLVYMISINILRVSQEGLSLIDLISIYVISASRCFVKERVQDFWTFCVSLKVFDINELFFQ